MLFSYQLNGRSRTFSKRSIRGGKLATVYLIHFDSVIGNRDNTRGQARHYIGYTRQFKKRMSDHANGRGAAIMAFLAQSKIGWKVVRRWHNGTRKLERQLKNRKQASHFCPVCKEQL